MLSGKEHVHPALKGPSQFPAPMAGGSQTTCSKTKNKMGAWAGGLKLQGCSLLHSVDMAIEKPSSLLSLIYSTCKMGLLGGLQVCFVKK